MDQLSWPKMLVLIARVSLDMRRIRSTQLPTVYAVRAQKVCTLGPPARRALVQRCDILQTLAGHEPLPLLAV
jgi:hypothetical protein